MKQNLKLNVECRNVKLRTYFTYYWVCAFKIGGKNEIQSLYRKN